VLLPLFEALEASAIGEAVRNSLWLFPVVEAFHLLGLAVIGGAILVVDFRLLGLGLRTQPVSKLARDVQPWVIGSLIVMILSGVPLLLQLRVLDENDGAAAGRGLYLHHPPLRHVRARRPLLARVEPDGRRHVAGALVHGGLGRPVDRVLGIAAGAA
jgi:hypothetical protein